MFYAPSCCPGVHALVCSHQQMATPSTASLGTGFHQSPDPLASLSLLRHICCCQERGKKWVEEVKEGGWSRETVLLRAGFSSKAVQVHIRKKGEVKVVFFFFFHFPPFILGIKTSSTLLTKQRQNTGDIYHIFLPVALAHPYPTKRDQKNTPPELNSKTSSTWPHSRKMAPGCTAEQKEAVCSVSEAFSIVSCARWAAVTERAVCQMQAYLQCVRPQERQWTQQKLKLSCSIYL